MTFAPADWVGVADDLVARAGAPLPEEAALRAAIGRYYYAVLLHVRDDAVPSVMPVDREATHAQVIRELGHRDDPRAQRLAADLRALRQLRNQAEYGDPLGAPRQLAARCRKLASAAVRPSRGP